MTNESAIRGGAGRRPFGVAHEAESGVDVVLVRGELDLSTAPELEKVLDEVGGEVRGLVIDLSACDFLDSTGIAVLIREFQRAGGEQMRPSDPALVLCGLRNQVRRILTVAGISYRIPTRDERREAIAAVSG